MTRRDTIGRCVDALAQLRTQDLEPDPKGGGPRIRRGVAEDRRVSVTDPEMRHGRKSESRSFSGFKTHLAADIDTNLVLACDITPANRPEAEAATILTEGELSRRGASVRGDC